MIISGGGWVARYRKMVEGVEKFHRVPIVYIHHEDGAGADISADAMVCSRRNPTEFVAASRYDWGGYCEDEDIQEDYVPWVLVGYEKQEAE